MFHYFIVEIIEIYFRGFLTSGMLVSDQRWRSCWTLSDGKYNNNNTSNTKREGLNTKCEYTRGHDMPGRPRYDEATSFL